ncbi:hypothetical protein Dimus_035263, partial [Dionaea muscipula]
MKHPNDEDTCVLNDLYNQSHCDYLDSVASFEALEESTWEPSSDSPPTVPKVNLRQPSSLPTSTASHTKTSAASVSFSDLEE